MNRLFQRNYINKSKNNKSKNYNKKNNKIDILFLLNINEKKKLKKNMHIY